jgi:hypothetical protein
MLMNNIFWALAAAPIVHTTPVQLDYMFTREVEDSGASRTERPLNITLGSRDMKNSTAALIFVYSYEDKDSLNSTKIIWGVFGGLVFFVFSSIIVYVCYRNLTYIHLKTRAPKNKDGPQSLRVVWLNDLFHKIDKAGNRAQGSEAEVGIRVMEDEDSGYVTTPSEPDAAVEK